MHSQRRSRHLSGVGIVPLSTFSAPRKLCDTVCVLHVARSSDVDAAYCSQFPGAVVSEGRPLRKPLRCVDVRPVIKKIISILVKGNYIRTGAQASSRTMPSRRPRRNSKRSSPRHGSPRALRLASSICPRVEVWVRRAVIHFLGPIPMHAVSVDERTLSFPPDMDPTRWSNSGCRRWNTEILDDGY